MKRVLRYLITMMEQMPFTARLITGAAAGYRFYIKKKRFHSSSIKLRRLFKEIGIAYRNYSKIDNKASLPIKKVSAFRLILDYILNEVESKGIDVIIGQDIPSWYPKLMLSQENVLFSEIGNLTPGYSIVLKSGLIGIFEKINRQEDSLTKESFILTIEALKEFLEKLKTILRSKEFTSSNDITAEEIAEWIDKAPWYPPKTFEEALFSIWLLHLLCWYDNHYLVGLGRLDQLLYPYLEQDLTQGRIDEGKAYTRIKQFMQWLNNSRFRKSNLLLGDTGQTLIIGGVDSQGRDATNPLSLLFIKAAEELKLPEPKIVARVHSMSPEEYMSRIAGLVKLNLGYPLICNDDVVIPTLIKAHYSKEDARDYAVAACWEYLVPGHSFDQGNVGIVSFLGIVLETLNDVNKRTTCTFKEFMDIYNEHLKCTIEDRVKTANAIRWISAPYLSIMMEECIENCKDISEGGCKYNNYGLLGSGLADTVDSLFVIKEFLSTKIEAINNHESRPYLLLKQLKPRFYSYRKFHKAQKPSEVRTASALEKLHNILRNNYQDNEAARQYFKCRLPKFGNDDDRVDSLLMNILDNYARFTACNSTKYGGIFRPGLGSAASYIYEARKLEASPNGRKAGEAYAVNYSPSINTPKLGPTAILRSVTKPDLSLMTNCCVVEISMDTSFMAGCNQGDIQWIKWLIQGFTKLGGTELQFNLLDAELLRKAQKNPDQYTNLLVRVWGFSAYFVDLPKEFQDNIIARVESCQT